MDNFDKKIDFVIDYFRRNMRYETSEPFAGYLSSREREKDDESERENLERKMRMKFGKHWKTRHDDTPPLRKGEVRKWNPKTKKYESNLDK